MLGEDRPNVGFFARNVGSVSGFLKVPDIAFTNKLNGLRRRCRECQVLLGGETSRKNEDFARNTGNLAILLIRLDLNDVGD
jgi:hypothetical protein